MKLKDNLVCTSLGIIIGVSVSLAIVSNDIAQKDTHINDLSLTIKSLKQELNGLNKYNDILHLKNEAYYTEIHNKGK